MIDDKIVLTSCITLLLRESQLEDNGGNSVELVKSALDFIDIKDQHLGVNVEKQILQSMKDLAVDMCRQSADHQYDLTTLLQRVKLISAHDDRLYAAVEQGVRRDLDQKQLLKTIINLRKYLQEFIRTENTAKLLAQASYQFRYNRESISDITKFLQEHVAACETLQSVSKVEDPAILNDVDLGDVDVVAENLQRAQQSILGTRVYKSGWNGLNEMLQGGFRPASIGSINALQHNYKTGFSLSVFRHIGSYNVPFYLKTEKKPLLLRISFEDEVEQNIQFMYQEIKYTETREFVDIKDIDRHEMAKYIKSTMQATGFEVRMVRVDPTQWSYRNLVDYVLKVEAQGYKVEVLMIDYLGMLPTVGCNTAGPMGTDMRDLFRRIRNFCAARDICCLTPHQLSTEAKGLLRTGVVPEHQFVKELEGKGYTAGSKQLDQELDLEIFIHKVKHNGKWYLTVQRGKHRIPTIVDDDYKYFILPFPYKMPIPADVLDEKPIHTRKLPSSAQSEDSGGLF